MSKHICSIEDCGKPVLARDWCSMHYTRWRNHGDPLGGGTPKGAVTAHYWTHLMLAVPECKLWPYATARGYGVITLDGRQREVHHLACIAWHGPRPTGMQAAHGPCHTTLCWNGAHVSWEPPSINSAHRRRDGTAHWGALVNGAKLTDEIVLEIRKRWNLGGITHTELARQYAVSRPSISNILAGKVWRHLL